MNQTIDLNDLTKATRRREFEDGLVDFALALGILVFCLLDWFIYSPSGLRWYATALVNFRNLTLIGLIGLAGLIFFGAIGVRRAIDRIRLSTTWRDGFVKPLRRQATWPTILLSVFVMLSMIIGAVWLMDAGRMGTESVLRILVASVGIATGLVYFGMGVSLGLRRYLAVGLAGGVLSAGILLSSVSFSVAWLILGFLWAAVLCLSGAWALWQTLSAKTGFPSE